METLVKTRYHLPELDEFVAKACEEIKAGIKPNAEDYAARNQPPPDNEDLRSYVEEPHLKHQSVIDEVNRRLQKSTSIHHVAEHRLTTENRLRENLNRQSEVKGKLNEKAAELRGKKPPFNKRKIIPLLLISAVLAFGDVIFNVPVFELYGYPLIEATFLSAIFSFLLGVLGHFFRRIVSLGKSPWQRWAIGIALITVLFGLFYTMAAHRVEFLALQNADDTGHTIHISPWVFVTISMLFFLGVVAINDFLFPSAEKREAMREYERLTKEHDALQKQYDSLKAEEAALEQEHIDVRHMNASILEYGCSLEEIIISRAHECFALWKKHNTMHRKDNCRPRSFDVPGYPLKFRTNFQSIKAIQQ